MDGYPHIFEIVKEPPETKNFGGAWHSDTTYLKQPAARHAALCRETPSHGGDTLFANQCLPTKRCQRACASMLDTLVGVNSANLKYGGGRPPCITTSAA